MPEPNVLELLSAMQTQNAQMQAQWTLREALDDSGLPPEAKKAIRQKFAGKPLDLSELDTAIEEAQAALKESVAAKEREKDSPPPEALETPLGHLEIVQVNDRWSLLREGKTIGNYATREQAKSAYDQQLKLTGARMDEALKRIESEYENRTKLAECRYALRESLDNSGLPTSARAQIESKFKDRIFESDELTSEINGMWDVISPYYGSGDVNIPGQERITARYMESEYDKLCVAFDGFWANEDLKDTDGKPVRRFRNLQEAYEKFMKRPYDPMRVLQEMNRMTEGQRYDSHGRYGVQADGRYVEAITTTSWAQIMGDSITRRMLAEYRVPNLQLWREIVSEISTINDFRLQRRMRFGGYGTLPVVNEGISYTPLPTPTDQEAQFRLVKRGGLESITLEAMANDDVGVIRRIPQKLGRAAAQTLFRGIFDMIDQNMALTFDDDTTALFTAGHANTRSGVALNAAGLDLAVQDMAAQTGYNNSVELLGLRPKYLIHPAALWRPATKLTQTERGEPGTADNDMNPYLRFGIIPIEVDYWTNPNRWYLIADKRDIPTIEVGFFRGNEDPEIFVADQENISGSSMFEADKVTWKIRHIWAAGILDSRAFWGSI